MRDDDEQWWFDQVDQLQDRDWPKIAAPSWLEKHFGYRQQLQPDEVASEVAPRLGFDSPTAAAPELEVPDIARPRMLGRPTAEASSMCRSWRTQPFATRCPIRAIR